jgi:hypothetical protein
MDLPTELRGRVVTKNGFDYTNTVFIVADDSNIDIMLRVYAPGMAANDFNNLCLAIGDRLNAALVGLNSEMVVEIHRADELNHFRIVINNPEYMGSESPLQIVLATTTAITQASEYTLYRRVITLKRWECAVLVDWDEPFSTNRKEFILSLPADDTGLDSRQRELLAQRIDALCDRGVIASVRTHNDTVEITLWHSEIRGLDANMARAHIARIMFVLGTAIKLKGINSTPVVQLTHAFTPFVDDGSEPAEKPDEY